MEKKELEKIIDNNETILVEEVSHTEDTVVDIAEANRLWKIKELQDLIEKERKEAVRGFAKWLDNIDGTYHFTPQINEYLSSQEGDNDAR